MRILRWALVAVLAVLTGWLVVSYMTVPPPQMSAYLAAACFGFAGLIVLLTRFRGRDLAIAIGLSVALLLGGYWANATVVLGRED